MQKLPSGREWCCGPQPGAGGGVGTKTTRNNKHTHCPWFLARQRVGAARWHLRPPQPETVPAGPYPKTRASESASLSHSLGALQRGRSCTTGESARVPCKTTSQSTKALNTVGEGRIGLPARCLRAHPPRARLKGQGAQYEEEPFVPGEQPQVLSSLRMVPAQPGGVSAVRLYLKFPFPFHVLLSLLANLVWRGCSA